MEKGKKIENITATKVTGESKIPKPAKCPSSKVTSTKTSIKKKAAPSSKITTKVTTAFSKQKQTQIVNLPKNVKRMSVVKISNDVMNHFQDENLKTCDHATESAAGIKVLDTKNTTTNTKRAPLKEQFLQASQKQSGSLTKRSSAPDLKQCAAFGGIRFTKKRNTCRKFDMFQKMTTESKDCQAVNDPELKRIASAKAIDINEIEWSNEGNLEDPPAVTIESSKVSSLTVKQLGDKMYPAFAGMRIKPKRKSTHPKPDIFERVQEESKIADQEQHFSGASAEQMKMSNGATKVINRETQLSQVEMLEHTSTQNARFSETVSISVKETSQVAAFGGIRFAPKWKSTPIRPNIFENIQKESKTDRLESQPTDSSTNELKAIPASTTAKIIETDDEKLEQLKTKKPESSKNDESSKNAKKVIPPAFGGLRFKPRQKKLHDIFEAQKSNVDNQMQS
ncbi:unnamed protein product [Larinioides sclopetarius]|uniref:Uncharacterized protein n=1 Tax=Larinioides sclopetarius TaxID=280406 RepID=A0AAV1Z734_9ARAC